MFFLSLFLFVVNINAKDKIYWDTVNYPPSLISEGNYKNQGFSDMSRELLMFNLKEYEHELLSGSIQKAMGDLESNENFCFVGLTRDKYKEEFIQFSKPFIEILPNELIIRAKDKKRFKSYIGINNVVNLHRLLQNNGFIFGYVNNRKYTSYIDRLILLNEEKKHLFKKEVGESTRGLVELLNNDKFDYTIEYPTIVSYVKNEQNIKEEFLMFPIASADELTKLYVGCSQNEFGKNVIQKVDKIIEQNESMFKSFYRTWLDYDSKKQYEQFGKLNK